MNTNNNFLNDDSNFVGGVKIYRAIDAFMPRQPIKQIVEGIIYAGTLNVFVGPSESLKTWLLLDMGICIAAELNWAGLEIEQSNVLYIDEEMGPGWLGDRVKRIMRGRGLEEDQDIPFFYTSLTGLDLSDSEKIDYLMDRIEITKANLVIIDAFSDITPGLDENTKKDMKPAMLALLNIVREREIAIILVHHTGKSGDSPRGSSVIEDTADSVITVNRDKRNNNIKIKAKKTRLGKPFKEFSVKYQIDDEAEEFSLSTCQQNCDRQNTSTLKEILRLFMLEPRTTHEVMEYGVWQGYKSSTAKSTLFKLIKDGSVERIGNDESGYALYQSIAS